MERRIMEKQNKGGAPKKAAHELRSERLECRLTMAQKAEIESIAGELGMTLTAYAYQRLTKTRLRVPSPTDQFLKTAVVELNRIGVNINQIAHAYNLGKSEPAQLEYALGELVTLMRRIDGAIR